MNFDEDFKKKFKKWVDNHPDVWDSDPTGTPHFWWVQNALGDLFNWGRDYVIFIYKLLMEKEEEMGRKKKGKKKKK